MVHLSGGGDEAPSVIRELCREGVFQQSTNGLAKGYAQGNLVLLPPGQDADAFAKFCMGNPKPCPLLEVVESGPYGLVDMAKGVDLRTDLPKYLVYRGGKVVEERTDIKELWVEENQWVAFVIGCSFSFEDAIERAGLSVRHNELGTTVPMYKTTVDCRESGGYKGKMVMSMRPYKPQDIPKVINITGKFSRVHGAPLHVGKPKDIGISDLSKPDYGDPPEIRQGEVPVFWGCGVTPQLVLSQCRPNLSYITHKPGHMLVLDKLNADLARKYG
ncbi:unnamed protein product [Chrysoparadoxa australica]